MNDNNFSLTEFIHYKLETTSIIYVTHTQK